MSKNCPKLEERETVMSDNVYFAKLKEVIEEVLGALEDNKISMPEVWSFLLTVGQATQAVLAEMETFDETDLALLQDASILLYSIYVEPIDLPGPDYIIDPLLMAVIPGLVEGAFILVRNRRETEEFLNLPVEGE